MEGVDVINPFAKLLDTIRRANSITEVQRATGWIPLPGGRLELRDTGFGIQLRTDRGQLPYILVDPDGRNITESALLQPLKQLGEQMANDRNEFRL